MNISKRKQGILAIICTIAMIVTSITVYNPREVKAAASGSGNGMKYTVSGESQDGGLVGFACTGVQILSAADGFMHFVWSGEEAYQVDIKTIKAQIDGVDVSTYNSNPSDTYIGYSQFKNLEAGEHQIKISGTTSVGAKEIYATATLKIEKVGGTAKPSAPVGLVAHIDATKTYYTIAFAAVEGAESYKFYLNGKYIKDITNGGPKGTVTIEELGLKAGETYQFGVSAVNAAGVESDITTIDVTAPEKKEETTTPTPEYKDGEVLLNEANKTEEVPPYQGGLEYQKEYKNTGIRFVKGKKYVAEVVVSSTAAKKIGLVFQRNGEKDGDWRFVNDANAVHYVNIAAGNKVKITYVFESNMSVDDGVFDIYLGIAADATTMVFESKKLTTYNEVPAGVKTGVEVIPSQTKYTVTEDGVAKEVTEGSSYTFGKNAQGYYDATNGVAYAPEEVITVDRNITVTGIKLNVAMESGAGIKLTTPTGLRFKTNVTGTTDILSQSDIIKTGTIITASDILDGGTVDDNFVKSNKLKLNIENNGWYGNTVGTFCASIVELQEANYARDFVGVGYVTIKYNNNAEKTIYAPSGTVRAVATVAQNIKNSKAIYQNGMTYYNYLKSLNKGYDTIIETYAATKNNQ